MCEKQRDLARVFLHRVENAVLQFFYLTKNYKLHKSEISLNLNIFLDLPLQRPLRQPGFFIHKHFCTTAPF